MTGTSTGFIPSGSSCFDSMTWVRAAYWAAVISMMTEPVEVDPILRILEKYGSQSTPLEAVLLPIRKNHDYFTIMKNALIGWGGWEGHEPRAMAIRFKQALENEGFAVEVADSSAAYEDPDLERFDLLIPNSSMGEINEAQLNGLLSAVRAGSGLAGIHGGMCDSFRGYIDYQWMTGGQFLGHPYVGEFEVRRTAEESSITAGMPPAFTYDSEQYYMMVDPAVRILAETTYHWEGSDVPMPVVWTKAWGKGRVFYSALGHLPGEFDSFPDVWTMTIRGMLWASR
jgi:type 1 glutamine amidotransferase